MDKDITVRDLSFESIKANIVDAPKSGVISIVNIDGTLKQVDSSGTAASLGGVDLEAGTDIDITNSIISALSPKDGDPLTDGDQTIQPGTDKASRYRCVAPITANRSTTIGTTSVPTGLTVCILREDTSAFSRTLINDGPGGGNLRVFQASPTCFELSIIQFDGSDWSEVGFYYVTRG